jgi:site-specific DNA-methyltransferase (adenine-specific)
MTFQYKYSRVYKIDINIIWFIIIIKPIMENLKSSESECQNTIIVDLKPAIEVKNTDGITFLQSIADNSIDLILTDPPYIISRESGMNTHYETVKANEENKVEFVKTEEEWNHYKKENKMKTDEKKENYMKYGTIYGKKYCVKTDYGDWDKDFTVEILDTFVGEYYKKLKKGGTLILFFDLFKITTLKDIMEKHKFKQIRFIEWIKTNPQPINSAVNYLTNCREIALLGIKGAKPTFHSKYDNGIYHFPLQGGVNRFHPTQKSLPLFEELIKKHSNEGDTVLDTFLGGGTTAVACRNTKRHFKGCEISKEYYDKMQTLFGF